MNLIERIKNFLRQFRHGPPSILNWKRRFVDHLYFSQHVCHGWSDLVGFTRDLSAGAKRHAIPEKEVKLNARLARKAWRKHSGPFNPAAVGVWTREAFEQLRRQNEVQTMTAKKSVLRYLRARHAD